MPDEPEYLDAVEAARRLGIGDTTFEALAERGLIPAGLHITQRTVRWRRDTVEALKVLLPWLLERRLRRRGKTRPAKKVSRESENLGRRKRRKRPRENESGAAPSDA